MRTFILLSLTISATTAAWNQHQVQLGKAAAAGAVVFCLSTAPALGANVEAGEQIFNTNCAACHAGGQNVIMPEKTLEKEALETYLTGGRNEAAVRIQVTYGKNAMPAFGGRLGDEDIANVASFVITKSKFGWDDDAWNQQAGKKLGKTGRDVEAGEQIFNANCAACHAGGQNVIMPEKTLEKEALELYLTGGRNEAAVRTQVTNGKNAMPAFGGRLGEADIANVASFVITKSKAGWDEDL